MTDPSPSPAAPFPAELARALPKAELHVHLEGTVDAATLLALCARHGVTPPAPDEAGVAAWYRFDDFPHFLERYFFIVDLLRDPDDLALVAEAYLVRAHDQGVVHVEYHVSACGHLVEYGKRWRDVQSGVVAGCEAAAERLGIGWALIPDVSPHLAAADCARAIAEVLADRHPNVVAVGMG